MPHDSPSYSPLLLAQAFCVKPGQAEKESEREDQGALARSLMMMAGPGNHKSFQGPSAPRCPLLISQLVSGTQQDARLFAITLA